MCRFSLSIPALLSCAAWSQDESGGPGAGSQGSGGSFPSAEAAANCPAPPPAGLKVRLVASLGTSSVGDGVSTWLDHSLAANPAATQREAERRPILLPAAVHGKAALHFDGNDDFLELPFAVNGRDHMTVAAVSRTWAYQRGSENTDCDFDKDGVSDIGRELNCSGTDQNVVTWNEGAGKFAQLGIFLGVGQREVTFRFGTGQSYQFFKTPYILEKPIDDAFVGWVAVLNGMERQFYLNGSIPKGRLNYRDSDLVSLTARADHDESGTIHRDWPAAVADTEASAWIGRGRFGADTSYWAGDLAELLIYETALNDSARALLRQYMNCAYGVP